MRFLVDAHGRIHVPVLLMGSTVHGTINVYEDTGLAFSPDTEIDVDDARLETLVVQLSELTHANIALDRSVAQPYAGMEARRGI